MRERERKKNSKSVAQLISIDARRGIEREKKENRFSNAAALVIGEKGQGQGRGGRLGLALPELTRRAPPRRPRGQRQPAAEAAGARSCSEGRGKERREI